MRRLVLSALVLLSVPSVLSAQEVDRAALRKARATARAKAEAIEQAHRNKRQVRFDAWQGRAEQRKAARVEARQTRDAIARRAAQSQSKKSDLGSAALERMRRAETGNYGSAKPSHNDAGRNALLRRAGVRPGPAAAQSQRKPKIRRPAIMPIKIKKAAMKRPAVRKTTRSRNN